MNEIILLLVIVGAVSAFFKEPKETLPNKKDVNGLLREPFLSPTEKIINGIEVIPHSIPYQVYLKILRTDKVVLCGGSLITRNYVLTAAHCLENATAVKVKLGAHNLWDPTGDEIELNAKNWKIHENYNNPNHFSNDLGLVELSSSVNLSKIIGLVKLPSRVDVGKNLEGKFVIGLEGRVSGWGRTKKGFQSIVLFSTTNTILSNEKCSEYFAAIINQKICLSGSDHSNCNGDSGGPMVVNGVQIGIVSYGYKGCPPNVPQVYTRVDQYLDWIEYNSDWKASENSSDKRV